MPSDSFRNCVKVGGRPCSATIAATVDGMSVVRRAAYTTPWTRARVRRAQASVFLSDACAHAPVQDDNDGGVATPREDGRDGAAADTLATASGLVLRTGYFDLD